MPESWDAKKWNTSGGTSTTKQEIKRFPFLMRRGFSMDMVRQVLGIFREEEKLRALKREEFYGFPD